MQKNEDELLRPWVDYYLQLTDPGHIYIYDNGSTSSRALEALEYAQQRGVNVNYSYSTRQDFENKGRRFLELYRSLNSSSDAPELYFPLDCDEFIAVPTSGGDYTCDRAEILEYFSNVLAEAEGRHNFRVTTCLNNVPGVEDEFSEAVHRKVFLGPQATLNRMDTGYHHLLPEAEEAKVFRPTGIAYLHFHNRSYGATLRASREKLATRVDDFSRDGLASFWESDGRGKHLVKYFNNSQDWYYRRFQGKETVHVDCARWFGALGHPQPYARIGEEVEQDLYFLRSPSNFFRLPKPDQKLLRRAGFAEASHLIAVGPGFPGLAEGSHEYSAEVGYGWDSREGLLFRERDRNTALSNFALSFRSNTYRLDVPAGHYRVGVFGSDNQHQNHYVGIAVNGRYLGEARPLKAGFFHAVAEVHAVEGAITIEFRSSEDNWIAGLIALAPLTTRSVGATYISAEDKFQVLP